MTTQSQSDIIETLYKIADLSNDDLEISEAFEKIHKAVSNILYAKNFGIILFDKSAEILELAYLCDEIDGDKDQGHRFSLGEGLSSHVIRTKAPLLADQVIVEELLSTKAIKSVIGPRQFHSWIGAPMLIGDTVLGLVMAQSYSQSVQYTNSDLSLLNYVSHHAALVINRIKSNEEIIKYQRQLVADKEHLNVMLMETQQLQQDLVQKEKMAALGGLVAGISHEVNTPLGICVTATSHLETEHFEFKEKLSENDVSDEDLLEYLDTVEEVCGILKTNTVRASELIKSFKQIAIDQSSEALRSFDLKSYLDEVLLSLKPVLRKTDHKIEVVCPDSIEMCTYAGALSQVLTNLIMNSLKHGFKDRSGGTIKINVEDWDEKILMRYSDDGKGMNKEDLAKLFDPFFTTARGDGGSGLGTNLLYNLIVGKLKGTVKASSRKGTGLHYAIQLPTKVS